ncbi:MAG: winged helix-turn-helix transcriptional regulator [Promethearchaeota archaeon]
MRKSKKFIRHLTIALLISMSMVTISGTGKKYSRSAYGTSDVLTQSTRNAIYKNIKQNEGTHFRKICRDMDRKAGVVQYHISILEKKGLIKSIQNGRYKCFFVTNKGRDPTKHFEKKDELSFEQRSMREKVIAATKRETPKKIISHLNTKPNSSHQEIAGICGVTPQAITFHCQRLEQNLLISSYKVGRQKFYILTESVTQIMPYLSL